MESEVEKRVANARAAQRQVEFWPQETVDRAVAAVGYALYNIDNASSCARLAVEETAMGVFEDKLVKHRKKTLGVLGDLHGMRTVGIVEEDQARGLVKIAKPVGVIGAITPVTNPSSTPAVNGLCALKGRNAIIFAPHPRSKRTTIKTVELMRKGLACVNAPEDLIQVIHQPSRERTRALMQTVDLVVATGSSSLVKAAHSSGTPAYGVGAGNAVSVIDDTADLEDAARKIAMSKVFDNASSCSSENAVVVDACRADDFLTAFQSAGGHLCTDEERQRLQNYLWPEKKGLNPDVVAQDAHSIADAAGISIGKGERFLIVRGIQPIESDYFAREKLCPVIALWPFKTFSNAIEHVERITRVCGYGHSCGIHSRNKKHIEALALRTHVSRMMVCQPQCYANSGNFNNGMPFSMTLGSGTWGGNITTENISVHHFLNMTWVSHEIDEAVPNEEEIFGPLNFPRDGNAVR